MNKMKYAVLVKLRAPTGVSVYYPLATITAPHYPLPPPTTIAGALAYSYLRIRESSELVENNYSPTVKILDKLKYVSAGAEGWTRSREVERIYQLFYQKKKRWNEIALAYTIGVRGNSYYANDTLYLFYVTTDNSLVKYAYGITRVGRKESLVSVDAVYYEDLSKTIKAIGKGAFETYFYFPKEIAVSANAEVISMPKLARENFGRTTTPLLEDYYISNGLEPIRGELKSAGALIRIEDYEIPIPRTLD
jgi:CRISPR-associated protein Cas5a/b/c